MGILARIFGTQPEPAPASRPPSSVSPTTARNATRRELVRVALRDTLNRHGIPADWVGVEALAAVTPGREPGLHLRLVLRHWEPELLVHAVALQRSVLQRVMLLDPLADGWMTGISWQLAPVDESSCPEMPAPGHWKALGASAEGTNATAATSAAARKAALDRLLRERDVRGGTPPEFSDTRPMFAATQPGSF
jgi:hypothetical protein